MVGETGVGFFLIPVFLFGGSNCLKERTSEIFWKFLPAPSCIFLYFLYINKWKICFFNLNLIF